MTVTGSVADGCTVIVDSTMTTWPFEVRVDVVITTWGAVGRGVVLVDLVV